MTFNEVKTVRLTSVILCYSQHRDTVIVSLATFRLTISLVGFGAAGSRFAKEDTNYGYDQTCNQSVYRDGYQRGYFQRHAISSGRRAGETEEWVEKNVGEVIDHFGKSISRIRHNQ